jgi:hypothetical protein
MDRSGIMSQSRTGATLTREAMGIQPGLPLTVSSGGIEELRRDIQRLMDIEAIKQLKHAYFRCIDTCNVEEMAELFLEDATVHYIGGFYEWKFANRAELLKAVREERYRGDRHLVLLRQHVGLEPSVLRDRLGHLLGRVREGRRALVDPLYEVPSPLRDQRPPGGESETLRALSGEVRTGAAAAEVGLQRRAPGGREKRIFR